MFRLALLMVISGVLGCGPGLRSSQGDGDGGGGTTADGDAGASQDGGRVTTGAMTSSGPVTTIGDDDDDDDDDDDVVDDSGGGSSDDGGSTFLQIPDGCGQGAPEGTVFHCTPVECNTFDPDCVRGDKCTPWANDGGTELNSTRCIPIVRDPAGVGDACTMIGSQQSGIDDCDGDSLCWGVDPDTLEGTCVAHCEGDDDDPECDAGLECMFLENADVALCLPSCDPLDAGTCSPDEVCIPAQERFVCTPRRADVAPRGECYFDTCDPGSLCAGDETPGCEDGSCCVAYCDLTAPSCADEGDVCTPYYVRGREPEGLDHVGVCLPAA